MRNKLKKILASLLVVAMILTAAPLSGINFDFTTKASALELTGQCGDNVYWTFDEETGTLTVSGSGEMKFTGESPFKNDDSIKRIIVEDNITSIAQEAFYSCDGLTSVILSDSVTRIEKFAFAECKALQNVIFPSSGDNIYIGVEAFCSCESLDNLDFKTSVSVDERAFWGCSKLSKVILPDSSRIYSSDGGVFQNCTSLKEVQISGYFDRTVALFSGCENLKKVKLSSGMPMYLETDMFCDCKNLEDLEIYTGFEIYISGVDVFAGCTSLSLPIELSLDSFKNDYYENLQRYEGFARGVRNVIFNENGDMSSEEFKEFSGALTVNGFVDNSGLVYRDNTKKQLTACPTCKEGDFTVPDGVKEIGEKAFAGCNKITSIKFPENDIIVGNEAFSGCANLTEIINPDSITEIDDSAFKDCKNLKLDFEQFAKLKVIGEYAFSHCSSIESTVSIPGNVEGIGSYAFEYCDIKTFIFNEGVERIGQYINYYSSNLSSVYIPDSIKSCGSFFFQGSSTGYDLNGNVYGSFGVHFSSYEGFAKVNRIASASSTLYINNEKADFLTVPEGTETIDFTLNSFTNVRTIIIPESVQSVNIESWQKSNASKHSNAIYYKGTEEQWNKINKSNLENVDVFFEADGFGKGSCGENSEWEFHDGNLTITGTGAVDDSWGWNYANNQITSVEIGDGITSVGTNIFEECTNLKEVYVGKKCTVIGDSAFEGCNNLSLVVYNGMRQDWKNKVIIGTGNDNLINGKFIYILFQNETEVSYTINSKEEVEIVSVNVDETMQQYFVPDEIEGLPVKSVGDYAFTIVDENSSLDEDYSNLNAISFGRNISEFSESAFKGCQKLTSVRMMSDDIDVDKLIFDSVSPNIIVNNNANVTNKNGYKNIVRYGLEDRKIEGKNRKVLVFYGEYNLSSRYDYEMFKGIVNEYKDAECVYFEKVSFKNKPDYIRVDSEENDNLSLFVNRNDELDEVFILEKIKEQRGIIEFLQNVIEFFETAAKKVGSGLTAFFQKIKTIISK